MPKEEPSEKAMDEQDQAEEQQEQPPNDAANDVTIEPSDVEIQQQLPMHTIPSDTFTVTELSAEEASSIYN